MYFIWLSLFLHEEEGRTSQCVGGEKVGKSVCVLEERKIEYHLVYWRKKREKPVGLLEERRKVYLASVLEVKIRENS